MCLGSWRSRGCFRGASGGEASPRRWHVVCCGTACLVLPGSVGAHSGCSPGSQDGHTFSFRSEMTDDRLQG